MKSPCAVSKFQSRISLKNGCLSIASTKKIFLYNSLRKDIQAREDKRKRILLRTTVDREASTLEENELSTFNWYKQWWPVQLVYNLETDRPNRIQLLGEYFVVWKSKEGKWIAMKDSCPHKLAPLSEGNRDLFLKTRIWIQAASRTARSCALITDGDLTRKENASESRRKTTKRDLERLVRIQGLVQRCFLAKWEQRGKTFRTSLRVQDKFCGSGQTILRITW